MQDPLDYGSAVEISEESWAATQLGTIGLAGNSAIVLVRCLASSSLPRTDREVCLGKSKTD